MKMLFSSPSLSEAGLLKSVLDGAGIACEIRNESIYPNFPGAPFQPEVWVVRNEDYTAACEVRDAWQQSLSATSEQSCSIAFVCAFAGFLLLAVAVLLAYQLACTGAWGHFAGVLILFGLPGAVLAWSGAMQLRGQLKKR